MLDHDYTSKPVFNKNFFEDWRKEMSAEERKVIKDLTKCDFKEMHAYFVKVNFDLTRLHQLYQQGGVVRVRC